MPTKTLTLTDCAVGTGVVTTRKPFASVEICHAMVTGVPFREASVGYASIAPVRC